MKDHIGDIWVELSLQVEVRVAYMAEDGGFHYRAYLHDPDFKEGDLGQDVTKHLTPAQNESICERIIDELI
jgi:hypothetical protein